MTTREQLKETNSEGDVMTLYTAVKSQGDFACFCRQFMHDEDCLVARNALWALTKTNKQEEF